MRKLFENMKFLSIVGGTFLIVTSCDLSKDSEPDPIVSYVNIYQASPNAPELKINLDDKTIVPSFNYTNHTGYLRFIPGKRKLAFGPAGASNIVADTSMTFEGDKAYSVYFVDVYDDADLLVLNVNIEKPADGKARIRFLNLSPDAPELSLAEEGGVTDFFAGQSFKEKSEGKELGADTYTLVIKATDGGQTLLTMQRAVLLPGWSYTIVVRGYKTVPSGSTSVLSAELVVD